MGQRLYARAKRFHVFTLATRLLTEQAKAQKSDPKLRLIVDVVTIDWQCFIALDGSARRCNISDNG